MRALIDDSKVRAKGQRVLSMVNTLEPEATSSEGIYLVGKLRSNVLATRGDTAGACKELDAVIPKVAAEEKSMAESAKIALQSCP